MAALDRIKWLLWHGNARDAIDDLECLTDDVAVEFEENPSSLPLRKLAAALSEFATYVENNKANIVDYGERFRAGERISTGFIESAINQIVDNAWTSVNRCAGRRAVLTCCSRREPGSSTATWTDSSVTIMPPADRTHSITLPPLCDGLLLLSGRLGSGHSVSPTELMAR